MQARRDPPDLAAAAVVSPRWLQWRQRVDLDADMVAAAARKAPEMTWLVDDLARMQLSRCFELIAMPGNVMLLPGSRPGSVTPSWSVANTTCRCIDVAERVMTRRVQILRRGRHKVRPCRISTLRSMPISVAAAHSG